eukprot:101597-Chlamydomonas_euryale.AAC.1
MDGGSLAAAGFYCSLARPVAEDGCVEQRKLIQSLRNVEDLLGTYSSAIRGYHEEASNGGTTLRDFVKLNGRT